MGYLSYVLYGLSLFSFIYMLSFFLFVRGLCLLSTFYIYCLSSYSYGGYTFCLLSIYTVFLPIRTGAIPPTYFLYILSFSLFVWGLCLLLIFYVGCLLRLCCYYRTYTRIHTRNEIPNLTPKISDLIRLFLPTPNRLFVCLFDLIRLFTVTV